MAIVASNDDIIVRKSCFNQDWFESTVPYGICLNCNAMQLQSVQTDTFILKYKLKILTGNTIYMNTHPAHFQPHIKEQFLEKYTNKNTTVGQNPTYSNNMMDKIPSD